MNDTGKSADGTVLVINKYAGTMTVDDSTFEYNINYDDNGGVIFFDSSTAASYTFTNCTFNHNQASGGKGGVAYIDDNSSGAGATISFVNSTFFDNSAGDDGGGIYLNSSDSNAAATVSIIGSTLAGNKAGDDGGVIATSDDYEGTLTINNSTLGGSKYYDTATPANNDLTSGNYAAGEYGGAVDWNSGTLNVINGPLLITIWLRGPVVLVAQHCIFMMVMAIVA